MSLTTIYLDHCVHGSVEHYLRERGHSVVTARREGMAAARDDEQIRYSTARGWMVLSSNERDFVGLHRAFVAHGENHGGIVVVPQKQPERQRLRCAMLLDWIRTEYPDTRNRLFRWTDLQQLLNGGYLLSGYTDAERAVALGRHG